MYEHVLKGRPGFRPHDRRLTQRCDRLFQCGAISAGDVQRRSEHRRHFNAGVARAPWTELCKAQVGVYTLELTNKGKGWHPHAHMIVLAASEPCQEALSAEWHRITGDSFIVDCRPITGDPSEGFMEVFKYAVKFSDLSLQNNWQAAQVLKGKRLLNSFGLFRGVEIPESLLDEPLDGLPYWDRFYRFLQGEYVFTGESPRSYSKSESTP